MCIRDSSRANQREPGLQDASQVHGGTILGVAVSVGKVQYLDLEKLAAAAMSVE